jgi:glycosyltransferase involved in cell wall biosynthesis
VLADIPSLRETWAGCAVFVPPDDESAWSAALNDIIKDDALRNTYWQRSLLRAQTFTPELMAQRYFAAYRYLLAGAAVPNSRETALVA